MRVVAVELKFVLVGLLVNSVISFIGSFNKAKYVHTVEPPIPEQ